MSTTVTNVFVNEQRELLNKCVVKFKFEKTDGTIKEAVGTTNLKFIPDSKHPHNPAATSNSVIPYYDLEVGDWRSMQINTQFIPVKSWKSVPKEYKAFAK